MAITKFLNTEEIASLLKVSKRWINQKANKENWPYKIDKRPVTGQKQKLYTFDKLPRHIQQAWADAQGKDLDIVRQEIFESDQTANQALSFNAFPERDRLIAIRRADLIDLWVYTAFYQDHFLAMYNAGQLGEDIYKELGNVSRATLGRWIQAQKQGGLTALCPKYSLADKGGPGRSLSDNEKELLLAYYLDIRKPTMKVALDRIRKIYKVEIPYHTACRYIKTVPSALITLKRDGEKKFKDAFEAFVRRNKDYPSMKFVTSDHKMFDFLVLDEKTGRIFRPHVTAMYDMRANKILSWCINDTPNTVTILMALEEMERKYGICDFLLIDRGKDYQSQAMQGKVEQVKIFEDKSCKIKEVILKGMLRECGCIAVNAHPYNARSKPIERWFLTCRQYFDSAMSTYVGSNTTDKPETVKQYYGRFDGKMKLEVTLTLSQVKTMFENFVNDYNANFKSKGKGMYGKTPDQVFAENWQAIRQVPEEYRQLLFAEKKIAVIGRNGINLKDKVSMEGIEYYAPELFAYKTQKMIIRRPFSDISKVFVYNLRDQYICTATNEAIATTGFSALDLKKIQKIRKQELAAFKDQLSAVNRRQAECMTMEEYLLNFSVREYEIKKPETCIAVGQDIELPHDTRRSQLSILMDDENIVEKSGKSKKSKISPLF